MNYSVKNHAKYSIISVKLKSATIEHTEEFKPIFEELLIDKVTTVLIDLTECDFIDSTFMGLLVRCHKDLQRVKGELKIICGGKIRFLLHDVTHLSSVIQLYETVEEAIKSK